jgi:low affinity Fe/Cu permease
MNHPQFDRFADVASRIVSRGMFFSACVLLVVVWAPSYFLIGNTNTWQLVINTATTIVTFLLVALLQNSQRRFEGAVQRKLDALADGLADLTEHVSGTAEGELGHDVRELREAAGLETAPK